MSSAGTEFSFGKNWERYVRRCFAEDRAEISQKHLLGFLERSDLGDSYFLDIGCGSGIHSLAAFRSGARKIVGIDVDPHSIEASRRIREMAGNPPNWEIREGSILDADFVTSLEPADIVYSWGALHHTGNLWQAVRNSASLVREGGTLYLALYEKTRDSDYWISVKQRYNRSSPLRKRRMELSYVFNTFFRTWSLRGWIRSIRYIAGYRRNRGMEFWTDVRDWLGGWPYEPSTPEEVLRCCVTESGLVHRKTKTGEANIEYLFRRPDGGPGRKGDP